MPRYLVVANQTLASEELWQEIRNRLETDPGSTFYVVVPNTAAAHYHIVPAAGGFVPMPSLIAASIPDTDEEATARARQLLDDLLTRLRRRDVEADGELGDQDPLQAVQEAMANRQFDEILLSTLPQRHSRWRRMDLPRQLQRRYRLPVTAVTANM
jgi:nucleotide-binding universal stress UspA family protein